MSILNDTEISAELGKGIQITNYSKETPPFGKDAQIQPSSFDLTIGKIFVPQGQEDEGPIEPQSGYILKPGRTVVVISHEEIKLSAEFAGFGFPPARISRQGLLMTNPGHIDPGFDGPLSFTVINMGSKNFTLSRGDVIATLLFFRLNAAVSRGFAPGSGSSSAEETARETVDRLAHDFMDVDRRADEIASIVTRTALEKVDLDIKAASLGLEKWKVWVPLLVAIVVSLGSWFAGPSTDRVDKIDMRLQKVENAKSVEELSEKIKDISDRLTKIEENK